MATRAAKPKTADEILAGLRARQREIVDAYMRELVPGYERHQSRLSDMREAGELVIAALLRALAEQRPMIPEEFAFSRAYLRRARLRGATEQELVRSARLWQRVLFDELHALAGPDAAAVAAQLARPLIDHVDFLSSLTAEVVEEIEAAMRLTEREGRAELIEDLLSGRPIATGSRSSAARACGLDDSTPIVVVSARPVAALPDPAAGPVAAVALAHASGDAVEPLFAVRGDEIVIVRPTSDDAQHLVESLEAAQRRLAQDGVLLAVGTSAVHPGPARVPAAYDEACLARDSVATAGGTLAIAVLGPLDYLFVRGGDDTAWSLVASPVRSFIEDDLSQAGLLLETLDAYVDASLNVKQAAEKLFVHSNTAHYRLAKIEELTGMDLRNLNDLQELVVAVRLARRRSAVEPGR